MKPKEIVLAFGIVAALVGGLPRVGEARQVSIDVRISLFHDRLLPYGAWTNSRYGQVWVPQGLPADWRPYTLGHWAYSDMGWVWVSDEPFGWATYHYGRWYHEPRQGWVWVPDTEWGPAWVAWRSNDAYVGWAPLPPGVPVTFGGMFDPMIDPLAFTFVRARYVVVPDMRRYYEPASRNGFYLRSTTNATRYTGQRSRVFNQGVRIETVEHAVGHAVPRVTVQASDRPGPARVDHNRVLIYRPSASERAAGHAAPPTGAGRGVVRPPSDRGRSAGPARGAAPPASDRGRSAGPARGVAPAAPDHGRGREAPAADDRKSPKGGRGRGRETAPEKPDRGRGGFVAEPDATPPQRGA